MRGDVLMNKEKTAPPPIIREYEINGTKYIVKATVKKGASENAAAKIRRMIEKEIRRKIQEEAAEIN
jgi:uncharacterized protein YajQ (UPF0234 family)